MRINTFKHYNVWHILPALYVTYEKNYYLSIDIMWINRGISIIIKNK